MIELQLLAYVCIVLFGLFFIILCPIYSRRKLREISRQKGFYEKYLNVLVWARQILLFFLPTALLIVLYPIFEIKLEYLLGTIVFGLSVVVFVSIHLPRMMKANLLVSFRINSEDPSSWVKKFVLRPAETHKVDIAIENLGFHTYKNFSIIFYFRKDSNFEILPPNHPKYVCQHLDYRKKFSIQREHNGAMFSPKENFLTIPPQEVFIFPLFIKTPNEEKKCKLTIVFTAENTWGIKRIYKDVSLERVPRL